MKDSTDISFTKELLTRLIKLANPLLMTLVFGWIWFMFYADNIVDPFYDQGNWAVIILFGIIYTSYARMYDSFMISMAKRSEIIYSQSLALLIADALMYGLFFILMRRVPNLLPMLLLVALQELIAILWTWGFNQWYFHNSALSRKQRLILKRLEQTTRFYIFKAIEINKNLSYISEDISDAICQAMEDFYAKKDFIALSQ